ncbi:hypothetical protein Bca52824_049093 [Brassica carinata]|uniref:Uncharacterized protein n=1 Tax=Brassica carinata TaxID=52824 RepID=A0A8X7RI12_BRACI|nr:hypothetical protein Bca52824_049093 [Brassica carinata]
MVVKKSVHFKWMQLERMITLNMKLLDLGELKRSCISFLDIEKHEIANSGGLDLGQELLSLTKVCQRMERHKSLLYNTRLRLFDIDEGEEVNLVEKCPQLKLQQQCTNHIASKVAVENGKFSTRTVEKCFKLLLWKIAIPNGFSAQHIDSVVRWGEEGTFEHSSFLAGGATVAA